jgi:TPR repeat protein
MERVAPSPRRTEVTRPRPRTLVALLVALALVSGARSADLPQDIRIALDRGEFARALRLLQPLAERGDPEAQLNLANLLRRGLGVPLDYAAAVTWYRKAAEQGDAAAQNALGALFVSGLGVPQDPAQAFDWYRRAAAQGAPAHQFDLALMYDNGLGVEQDFAQAAHWYAKSAEQGFADAEANLAFLYQQGAGVARDYARAVELYTRAARKGNAKAQNNLGLMYTRGEGVAQDYAAAVAWYRRAAAQGFAKAITNLGVMVENGFGVKQDEDEARRLYRLGGRQAADGLEAALDQARVRGDKRLVLPDAATRDGYHASAERGDAHAMMNLGLIHVRGLGVPQDYVLAYMWLNLAAAHGLADAVTLRDALARRLTAAQVNEAQRLARERWSREAR